MPSKTLFLWVASGFAAPNTTLKWNVLARTLL